MVTTRVRLTVIGSLLCASVAAPAMADPPKAPPVVPRVAAPAPRAPAAPAALAAPVAQVAVKDSARAAPARVELPKASARPAVVTPPAGPAMSIEPGSSDPGIAIKVDPHSGRVVVTGTAAGPRVKYLEGEAFVGGKPTKLVDYEVARGVSFQIDHEKMPDFSKDADYTRKNQWYFSHLASAETRAGESATTVANKLAASLNKGGAYKASVTETLEGAAITLAPTK